MRLRSCLLAIATAAVPVHAISDAASLDKIGQANVIDVPANVAIVLLPVVAPQDEYALHLVDEANHIVASLTLAERGSSRACVHARAKPQKLKVVAVSLRNERVVTAIVRPEPDGHVYDVSVWDQTPHVIRVVATAKLDLSGAASKDCRKLR